jgi:hypothetical protein
LVIAIPLGQQKTVAKHSRRGYAVGHGVKSRNNTGRLVIVGAAFFRMLYSYYYGRVKLMQELKRGFSMRCTFKEVCYSVAVKVLGRKMLWMHNRVMP